MSNVDINVDRQTDGWTDGRKIGRLYRTLLQAGAINIKAHSKKNTVLEAFSGICQEKFKCSVTC